MARAIRRDERAGLVTARSPELTGRVHLAYRRPPDRRRWRREFPGRTVPALDLVSLCGRPGLERTGPTQPADCGSCERILGSRSWRELAGAG